MNFLESFIDTLSKLSPALPDQKICIKNTNSITIFCSDAFSDFIGVPKEQILNRASWWLPLYDNKVSENIVLEEDNSVLMSGISKKIFKINKINGTLKIFLCIKSPIINPQTNEVVGIYINCIDNAAYNLLDTFVNKKSLSKQKTKLPNLTKREKQVIFLFLLHLTSEEIANIICQLENKKISKSAIDGVFNDQIYPKFVVNSRIALHKKLVSLGYKNMVPAEILSAKSLSIDNITSF